MTKNDPNPSRYPVPKICPPNTASCENFRTFFEKKCF